MAHCGEDTKTTGHAENVRHIEAAGVGGVDNGL
jgi:hypothetical protein